MSILVASVALMCSQIVSELLDHKMSLGAGNMKTAVNEVKEYVHKGPFWAPSKQILYTYLNRQLIQIFGT